MEPLEIERKYLIARPEMAVLSALPDVRMTEIVQTYLYPQEEGFSRRVRCRRYGDDCEFTYTRKKPVSFGTKIEYEDVISAETYAALLKEADPAHHPIEKIRCCFPYAGQPFELDLYAFSQTFATLEIELPDIHMPVTLPEWVQLIADVTNDRRFSNFSLSLTLQFPEDYR